MTISSGLRELRQLASLYGIQTAYYGLDRQRRSSSAESLLAVLRGLKCDINTPQESFMALRERRQQLARLPVEPVTLASEGNPRHLPVRLRREIACTTWTATLSLEGGQQIPLGLSGADLTTSECSTVEGIEYLVKQLPIPRLPLGYHRLTLEIPGLSEIQTLVISAPTQAYRPKKPETGRTWGVFLPLYSLFSNKNASATGDFSVLEELLDWIGALGGGFAGTLPILASFLRQPLEPSPYAPVSRLLWNEFYIDLARAPELPDCPEASTLLDSDSYQAKVQEMRRSPLVDYRGEAELKRRVLMLLAKYALDDQPGRSPEIRGFLAQHPEVEDYARFRATMERRGETWPCWPDRLRNGDLRASDYDKDERVYHLYAQWLAHKQVKELSQNSRSSKVELYLDLPLGVHPEGYDVWRRQDLFLRDFTVGAPPDPFFAKGQNWGFPPIHPQMLQQSGYDYYIAYLRHHVQAAGILRIDHVMGLHRLFWIPQGMDGAQGVYVRYPAEEFYAILALESHRHRCAIVGEDLGTVPPAVRPAMSRHGLYGMYVSYFQMNEQPEQALKPVSTNALASVNTHDMAPFAAFWQGSDVSRRMELAHQDRDEAHQELETRERHKEVLVAFLQEEGLLPNSHPTPKEVLDALLLWLGRSKAPMVVANLEDLWLETAFQNMPGTGPELPNWRRRASYGLEEFIQMPQVVESLRKLDSQRKMAKSRRKDAQYQVSDISH